ncbi:50S ribosomal protein L4 [Demequina oxidasica]|uniref:50S ribosomal protein L4 n=1 Tax=Demequina oxidasica TaxID=676199 RepID=UPI00078330A2|nr:50S ribosomal protein L4 [Demequina oxidasica]
MTNTQTVDVVDAKGKKAGTAELPAEVFDVVTNVPLIHQVVVAQRAAARQGTHATKTRAQVSGGGRKPYKQKGTGRARQGSIRAPQFAGGGIVHGPQPRDYSQRTPKKMKAAALRGALSDRARADRVHVLKSVVSGDAPSTKNAIAAIAAVTAGRRALIVLERTDELAWKSLRNAPDTHVVSVGQLNTYDVLINDDIVFTAAALDAFLAGPAKGASAKAVATESEAAATQAEETK